MGDKPEPLNHVFVDGENVTKLDLSALTGKRIVVHLLIGPNQKKLDTDLVERLLDGSDAVRLIRLKKSGKNALDFALAYYLGQTAATDPLAYFHIVSKDTGYDPLIEHLKARHVRVRRHSDFSTLTFGGTTPPPVAASSQAASGPDADFDKALQHLKQLGGKSPKTRKGLESTLRTHHGNKHPEAAIRKLVNRLESEKHLAIDEKGAVTYLG